MKILVTGGAGFIGSHIVDKLLEKNYQVKILDDFSTGAMKNIEQHIANSNLEIQTGYVTKIEDVDQACSDVSIICHQAGYVSVPGSIDNPVKNNDTNVTGFLNILECARKYNIKRIVYASSASVYGNNPSLPKTENEKCVQLSPYAVSKYISELYAKIFYDLYGIEYIGLRYFNVYGDRQNPNGAYASVIPKLIDKIKKGESPIINGDGSFSRDFVNVSDVADANLLAMFTDNKECFGEVFNIGTGSSMTILEMFNKINLFFGNNILPIFGPERIGDISHSYSSIEKAKKMLCYFPKITFEEGIKKTICSLHN